MGRVISRMVVLLCAFAVLGNPADVQAASLRLLRQSDAPPGFGKLHTKVYTHWVRKLRVTTTTVGLGKGRSSCDVLSSFKGDGWIQGAIQAFDSPGLLQDFELCDHLFASVSGARKAYAFGRSSLLKASAKVKGMKSIPGASIGDESVGLYGAKQGFITAELFFRRGAVLVEMIYLGSSQFSGASFLQTAQRANGRI